MILCAVAVYRLNAQLAHGESGNDWLHTGNVLLQCEFGNGEGEIIQPGRQCTAAMTVWSKVRAGNDPICRGILLLHGIFV